MFVAEKVLLLLVISLTGKVWVEIIALFLNFNGATFEIWEWVSNFFAQFIMDLITYLRLDSSWSMLVKGSPGGLYQ